MPSIHILALLLPLTRTFPTIATDHDAPHDHIENYQRRWGLNFFFSPDHTCSGPQSGMGDTAPNLDTLRCYDVDDMPPIRTVKADGPLMNVRMGVFEETGCKGRRVLVSEMGVEKCVGARSEQTWKSFFVCPPNEKDAFEKCKAFYN